MSLEGQDDGAESAMATAVRAVVRNVGSLVEERVSAAAGRVAEDAANVAQMGALIIGAGLLSVAGIGAIAAGLAAGAGRRRRPCLVGAAFETAAGALLLAARMRITRLMRT